MEDMGKLPPQAVDIEMAVLGELMIDKDAIDLVSELLHHEIFYKEENRLVCKAILKLAKENEGIDMLTVSEKLMSMNAIDKVGGPVYIAKLTSNVSSAVNIREHVLIVLEAYKRRSVIKLCNDVLSMSYDRSIDTKDVIDEMQSKSITIGESNIIKRERSLYEYMVDYIELLSKEDEPTYYNKTHLKHINNCSNGWGGGTLTVIAARPSMGKSALAVDIAKKQGLSGIPTAFFALEMKGRELAVRSIAAETGISTNNLNKGVSGIKNEDWNKIEDMMSRYKEVPFYIDDDPFCNIALLKAKIRRLFRKGFRNFYIDYLQLMQIDSQWRGDKNAGFGDITRQLKLLAMELDVSIVILSQVNRGVETRGGSKMPKLADLRDSGEIEQNIDNCLFLLNYFILGIKEIDLNGEIVDVTNKAMIDFAKCRGGTTGQFLVKKSSNQMDWVDEDGVLNNDPDDMPF